MAQKQLRVEMKETSNLLINKQDKQQSTPIKIKLGQGLVASNTGSQIYRH